MKRTYIIIGAVILVAVVGVLLFVFIKSGSSPAAPSGTTGSLPSANLGSSNTPGSGSTGGNTGAPAPGTTPIQLGTSVTPASGTLAAKTVGVLSNELAVSYFVDASNTITTVQPDGKIEQIKAGQATYLSSAQVSSLISGTFSYDGKKILVSFGAPKSPQWSLFDVTTKAWSVPQVSPLTAAWAPNSYQIAYFTASNGGYALQAVDLGNAKAKPRTILNFAGEDYTIAWPTATDVILSDRPSAYFAGSIFDVDLKTNALKSIVSEKVGLETLWNSDATLGVIFAGNSLARGGQLGIIDRDGTLVHELSFLTIPSKCVFPVPPPKPAPTPAPKTAAKTKAASSTPSSTQPAVPVPSAPIVPSLICGIPRETTRLSSNPLPDTYYERSIMTTDDFYSIDLITGSVAPLYNDKAQAFDASDVKFVNNTLFFINRYDQKLYGIVFG